MLQKLLLLTGISLFFGFATQAQQLTVIPTQQGTCTGQVILNNSAQYNSWSWLVDFQAVSETNDTISNLCYESYVSVIVNGMDTIGILVDTNATTSCADFMAYTNTINTNSSDCSGSVSTTINNGTAPYSYVWSTSSSTNSTLQNQCYGSGSVEITDVYGCVTSSNYFVDSNSICTGFIVSVYQSGYTSTPNSCDGVIYSAVSGGTAPYSYEWNNSTTNANNTQACTGAVVLIVTDANGCEFTAQINVQEDLSSCSSLSTSLTLTGTSTSSCTGSAVAAVSGGLSPYTYEWSVNAANTTNSIQNLCFGDARLYVTDANGCVDTTYYDIDSINPCANSDLMAAVYIAQSPTGPSVCDGQVSGVITGGVAPFSITWSGNSSGNTQQLTTACPGTIYLTVIDATGCSYTSQSYLNYDQTACNGFAINATIDSISNTFLCDANGTVAVTGGTTPYSYAWSNGNQTSATQTLCVGLGNIIVTDATGCTDTVYFYIDSISNSLVAGVYVTPESTVGGCDGEATVYPYGGVAPYTYIHSTGQTTQTATGLCVGIYTVVVTDATGTTYSVQYLISSPPNTSVGNGGTGNPLDSLYSSLVENCNIDYATLDTMFAYTYFQYGTDSVSVTWALVQGTDTNYMIYTYDLTNTTASGAGLTNVVLTIYCPFRGAGEYWMASDNIYLEDGTSGIEEKELDEIKIYQQLDDMSVWVILPSEMSFVARLHDISGKLIFENSMYGQKEKINLDNVSVGKYVLTIETSKTFKNILISK